MARLNKNQFQQMELPLNVDTESKVKQPHQMSPEEFASHPFAVFHTTHLPADKVLDTSERSHPGIHLGTDKAASQRHLTTGLLREHPGGPSMGGKPATMHIFHHDPGARIYKTSDDKANYYWSSITKNKTNAYYSNDTEDRGSLSLVVHNTSRLKSQHDYVTEAIKNGKEGEVHPHTMKLFKQGVLKKGFNTPYWVSKQRVLDGMSDQSIRRYDHFNPNIPKLDFAENSLNDAPPSHERKFFGDPGLGEDEPASRGPSIEGLKAEMKRRRKK